MLDSALANTAGMKRSGADCKLFTDLQKAKKAAKLATDAKAFAAKAKAKADVASAKQEMADVGLKLDYPNAEPVPWWTLEKLKLFKLNEQLGWCAAAPALR